MSVLEQPKGIPKQITKVTKQIKTGTNILKCQQIK